MSKKEFWPGWYLVRGAAKVQEALSLDPSEVLAEIFLVILP